MSFKELNFDELYLSDNVKRALDEMGYEKATEIQARAIPEIMAGRDLIGQSQTGTGKTASYGIPIIEKINTNDKSVQAIVLCPTRELATQISEELRKYYKYQPGIKAVAIYGGQSIERQIMDLKKGVQIVVGTPGRVMDHMRRKTLKLGNVKMVILDEADEMLNMGFEEDIETILNDIDESRQTILFSATMNERILKVARKYLNEPVNVKIKAKELTVENIEQTALEVKSSMKDGAVMRLLDVHIPTKAIIFCNTKRKVDDVYDILKSNKYQAEAIHGDIKQIQRDRIIKNLKSGKTKVLIATDVAARGIDIKDLDLVINYDVPQDEEYYVHRIGRTGRNGQAGKAFTFVTSRDKSKINSIERYAKTKIALGILPTQKQIEEINNNKVFNEIQEVINKGEFENNEVLDEILEKNDSKLVAQALFKMITSTKNISVDNTQNTDIQPSEDGDVKLFISLGKKDKISPKDIVGSFTANVDIGGNDIRKINVLDKFSFAQVPYEFANKIVSQMSGKQIKGKSVNIEIANH